MTQIKILSTTSSISSLCVSTAVQDKRFSHFSVTETVKQYCFSCSFEKFVKKAHKRRITHYFLHRLKGKNMLIWWNKPDYGIRQKSVSKSPPLYNTERASTMRSHVWFYRIRIHLCSCLQKCCHYLTKAQMHNVFIWKETGLCCSCVSAGFRLSVRSLQVSIWLYSVG